MEKITEKERWVNLEKYLEEIWACVSREDLKQASYRLGMLIQVVSFRIHNLQKEEEGA